MITQVFNLFLKVAREQNTAVIMVTHNHELAHKMDKLYKLKQQYPDLRPRDAATVHKAQGSTYETVFLDLDDLSTCRDSQMAARLLYVAFTRAKKRVVLYGHLASKYGGVVT